MGGDLCDPTKTLLHLLADGPSLTFYLQEETFGERSRGIWVVMNFPLTHRQIKAIRLLVPSKQEVFAMVF